MKEYVSNIYGILTRLIGLVLRSFAVYVFFYNVSAIRCIPEFNICVQIVRILGTLSSVSLYVFMLALVVFFNDHAVDQVPRVNFVRQIPRSFLEQFLISLDLSIMQLYCFRARIYCFIVCSIDFLANQSRPCNSCVLPQIRDLLLECFQNAFRLSNCQ